MIKTGNAEVDGVNNNQWFIGHFMKDPELRRDDIEVKWSLHPKGEENEDWAANDAYSLTVFVSGLFEMMFLPPIRPILLSTPGDYVLWDRGVKHYWRALEDTWMFTVRWPSLPIGDVDE